MPSTTSNTKKTTKTTTPRETTRRASQSNSSKYGQGWGGEDALVDVTTPSGATVQVRRVGLQGLINMGVLDSLDSLTAIVNSEVIPTAEGRKVTNPVDVFDDPTKVKEAIEMLDKITFAVVTQPKLEKQPEPDADGVITYEPGKFYINLIDIEDKTFIMSYVMGGTKDVEQFRAESSATLAGA